MPTQSTRLVFAPTLTAALMPGAPFAFIRTIAQVPPLTFHVAVTWPLPLLADCQKLSRAGAPAGAVPACVRSVPFVGARRSLDRLRRASDPTTVQRTLHPSPDQAKIQKP